LPAKREAIRKLDAWVATNNPQPQTKGESNDRSEASRTDTGKIFGFPERAKAVEEENAGRGRSRPD
jgi:hypothetical protein